MKGAIGNALILNIVITFITLFLLLVVGSMSYTKAIKVRNYLLTEVEKYHETNGSIPYSAAINMQYWDERVNPYLATAGYPLATKRDSCPDKSSYNYKTQMNTRVGFYDYCVYEKVVRPTTGSVNYYLTYMVLTYMKFDFPLVGNYIKIPITGETKSYMVLK